MVCQALDEDANYKFSEKYPDGKQFFQASKRQVPSFSVHSHPSVQNRSTLRLIYQHNDLTLAANAPPASFDFAGGTGIAGYVWPDNDTEHVIFLSQDGHVHELWSSRGSGVWSDNDLTLATGAPPSGGAKVTGYVWPEDDSEHVIYSSQDGHVHELYLFRSIGVWNDNDLTLATSAPPTLGIGDIVAYVWPEDNSEHVIYIGLDDGHVHELYLFRGSGWNDNDLTLAAAGAPPAVTGWGEQEGLEGTFDLAGFIWAENHSEYVIYVSGPYNSGANLHIYELGLFRGSGWWYTDLTSDALVVLQKISMKRNERKGPPACSA